MQNTYCHVSAQIADHVNQPDPQPLNWEYISFEDERKVIERLADKVDTETLVWRSHIETREISLDKVNRIMAEDILFCLKLIDEVHTGDAEAMCIAKFKEVAIEQVEEAMNDFAEAPKGYTMEELV